MPFVPFPNCVKLEQVFLWDNQIVENVFHYQKTTPWTTANMQLLAQNVIDKWTLLWKPNTTQSVSLTNIKVTDLTSEFAPGIEYAVGLPVQGTLATGSMPNSVTVTVTWITALRGRSYRGRTYHIGLMESQVDNNQISVSCQTALNALYIQYWAGIPILDSNLVVASRVEGGVERAVGVMTPVIGLRIERTIDSQRRRLPGRGR